MRDGNEGWRERNGCIVARFLNFLWGMETIIASNSFWRTAQFLNFLWGMETCISRWCLHAWRTVFELPMRDGNKDILAELRWFIEVFELPMRDGNLHLPMMLTCLTNCFWTSYEGWKQPQAHRLPPSSPGFWTSYEGWKQISLRYLLPLRASFLNFLWGMETVNMRYRTGAPIIVFELPMRDGNRRASAKWRLLWLVFELPMRDGNKSWALLAAILSKFLNFLWGMETSYTKRDQDQGRMFLNFLWGMETF